MEFICLGSGSSGNSYILKHNKRCVLVECGLRINKLREKLTELNISINDIGGALITHKHKDHSICKEQLKKLNIPVYEPYECELPFTFKIDWLVVYCFKTYHDVDSCGFVFIDSITLETMLFINDTNYFELEDEVKHLNYKQIAIECNHTYRKLISCLNEAENGKKLKFKRQAVSHLSLINTKKMLSQLSLNGTKTIYLMHLSQEASEPEVMKNTIQKTFGIETKVCLKEGGFE